MIIVSKSLSYGGEVNFKVGGTIWNTLRGSGIEKSGGNKNFKQAGSRCGCPKKGGDETVYKLWWFVVFFVFWRKYFFITNLLFFQFLHHFVWHKLQNFGWNFGNLSESFFVEDLLPKFYPPKLLGLNVLEKFLGRKLKFF